MRTKDSIIILGLLGQIPLAGIAWQLLHYLLGFHRSVCYLAAGKPVVTQETGFSKYIPTGNGLFGFSSAEEAVAAFNAINSDYPSHAQAARDIAREYFAAEKLLGKLLADVGVS